MTRISLLLTGLLIGCAGSPPKGHLRTRTLDAPQVRIKHVSGKQVVLDDKGCLKLAPFASKCSNKFTFFWCELYDDFVGLQSVQNRKYISVYLPDNAQVIARQDYIDSWERLTKVSVGDNKIAFKGVNGKYIVPDTTTQILAATEMEITSNCFFEIQKNP